MKEGKLYVILKKENDGTIKGLIENSFSMGLSPLFVRVWRENEIKSLFKQGREKAFKEFLPKAGKGYRIIFARANSKKCPVEIDMNGKASGSEKFNWRNKPFYKKITEK